MMLPAPIWRRCAAAVYDGLLLLGLWLVALMLDTVMRDAVGAEREWHALRAYLFLIGLAFFGWFWTHGGQTLGMRAWRLHLRRGNGEPPRWVDAALRYSLMLLCWGIVLTPALLQLPRLAAGPHARAASFVAGAAIVLGLLLMRLDARRRAPQDWLSGTETLYELRTTSP